MKICYRIGGYTDKNILFIKDQEYQTQEAAVKEAQLLLTSYPTHSYWIFKLMAHIYNGVIVDEIRERDVMR